MILSHLGGTTMSSDAKAVATLGFPALLPQLGGGSGKIVGLGRHRVFDGARTLSGVGAPQSPPPRGGHSQERGNYLLTAAALERGAADLPLAGSGE
jgi:hypothetical protein